MSNLALVNLVWFAGATPDNCNSSPPLTALIVGACADLLRNGNNILEDPNLLK